MWAAWRRGAVLYIRGHYLAFPSAVIAKWLRIPVFHEINGPYEDVFISHPSLVRFRSLLIWMQRQQYRWATGLIAVTGGLCRWAEKESGQGTCHLIPNGANIDLFHPGVGPAEKIPPRFVIFFGGLARWHGVPVMIDAVNHPDWPQDVHLVVIGDGQCSDMIHAAAKTNPRIHMLGRMANTDMPAYIVPAIAGLVPITNPGQRSDSGLMPLKLLETLSCGVPAIVTDFPGQAELVRAGNCGLVIPPDDAVALARAVADLATKTDLAREMGHKGRDLVVAHHSWDARAATTESLILNKN
jgi:glycosyltransferase involved in cell wall biosynthesis